MDFQAKKHLFLKGYLSHSLWGFYEDFLKKNLGKTFIPKNMGFCEDFWRDLQVREREMFYKFFEIILSLWNVKFS